MNTSIRVAILCHFSNAEIQSKLPLRIKVNEFAPWIVSTLRELEKRDDIEIHIISPHPNLYKDTSFILRNIHYHFFATGIPVLGRKWPKFFLADYYSNYRKNRWKIKNIISEVSPDLIHLYGAENNYYASAILGLLHLPHLITIQGFLFQAEQLNTNKYVINRIKGEKEIYSKARNFGIRYPYMEEELRKLNPEASFYWHHIPANVYIPAKIEKTFDVVYFAKLSKVKGIEDFIKVIGLVKKQIPYITTKVLGTAKPEYLEFLKKMAVEHNCSENIEFNGFIPTQQELHSIVSHAKVCLLPVYFDTIPGTIIESMFLETAVASYNTGGIPSLNDKDKTIELAEQGDLITLAGKVTLLLDNTAYRLNLVSKARMLVEDLFSPEKAISDQIKAYHAIIDKQNLK
jgi:glycosyltransferase involved in cell wall biosynthesis